MIIFNFFKQLFYSIFFKGENDVEYFLGLTPSGVIVVRSKTIIANYYWSRIMKIFYKNRFFMLKIRDKNVRIKLVSINYLFIFQGQVNKFNVNSLL